MPDVNGIAADSLLGVVLVCITIGTFLIVLVQYLQKNKDRTVKVNDRCKDHEDKIINLEKDVTELRDDIKEGFADIKTDIRGVHSRIDKLYEQKNGIQPYSRKA